VFPGSALGIMCNSLPLSSFLSLSLALSLSLFRSGGGRAGGRAGRRAGCKPARAQVSSELEVAMVVGSTEEEEGSEESGPVDTYYVG
jgi:hypothetical protein